MKTDHTMNMKRWGCLALLMLLGLGCWAQSKATEQEIWIENEGRRIFGVASIPQMEGKKKVAIVSHGFNGTHHFARDYYETLNALGYLVYSMDFPNGSIHSRSDNNTLSMSIPQEINDLKAIVRHFQQQPDVDTTNIVLIGESQGGLISAWVASELGDQVSRLILIYPALCIADNWNEHYPREELIPNVTDLWGVKLGRDYFMQLRRMPEVYGQITRYEGPVQIIHGSKDPVVPLSYSERAMKAYKQAHLGVIPGASHGFTPEQRAVSNAFIREFLEKD